MLKRKSRGPRESARLEALVGALVLLAPAGAFAQSWSMYDQYTLSYTIPFSQGPDFSHRRTSMWVTASVGIPGGVQSQYSAPFQVDTGSVGMVVPAYMVPGYTALPSAQLQTLSFSSSGNQVQGSWMTMAVTFPNATSVDGSFPTAVLPVFVGQTTNNTIDCTSPISGQGCIYQFGVGYGRPGTGDSFTPTPALNPLLNIQGMTGPNPTLRQGYMVTPTGLVVGLTGQNAGSGFSIVKLTPNPNIPSDWTTLPGQFSVNGTPVATTNQALLDSGLSYVWTNLGGSVSTGHCPGERRFSCASGSYTFSITLGEPGNPNTVSYSYREGAGAPESDFKPLFTRDNPPTDDTIPDGVNTGIHVFAGFLYFYDAAGGYVGLQPLPGMEDQVTFHASLSLTGDIILNDGFASNIPVYLADNTTLWTASAAAFAGEITGEIGTQLTIGGPGSVFLTGDVLLPGGILVANGGLTLGSNTIGSVEVSALGTLTNNGTLTGSVTNAGTFANFGTLIGNLNNSGVAENASRIEGHVFNAGVFSNDGTVTGHVTNEGLLIGNGTIGGNLQSPGSISPGHSIGTITVLGDATLASSTVYTAELGANGASDLLSVGGTLAINGALLELMPLAGFNPTLGDFYTIVSADTLAGSFELGTTGFGAASSIYPFLAGNVADTGGSISVVLGRSAVPFAALARTPNQRAAAAAVDALPISNPLASALASVSGAGAPGAFTQIDGEVYASTLGILQAQSAYLRNAVTARLLQAETGASAGMGPSTAAMPGLTGATLWGQAYAGWGTNDGNFNATGTTSSIGGFIMGLDGQLADWRVGLAAGFGQSQYSLIDSYSSGESDNYDLALYAGRNLGPLNLRLGAAYSWHDLSSSRTVALPDLAQTYSAGYAGGTAQVFGELGYGIAVPGLGVPARLEPFVGLSYVTLSVDSFKESPGAAALTGTSGRFDAFSSTLGMRSSLSLSAGEVPVALTGTLGWQHAYGQLNPDATLAFASGGVPFTVSGAPLASDSLIIATGLSAQVGPNITLGVSYGGQISSSVSENAVKGTFFLTF